MGSLLEVGGGCSGEVGSSRCSSCWSGAWESGGSSWLLWQHNVSRGVVVTWRNIVYPVYYIYQCNGRFVCYRQLIYYVCPYWMVTMNVLGYVDGNDNDGAMGLGWVL